MVEGCAELGSGEEDALVLREAVANQFVWGGRVVLLAPQQEQWSGASNMRERWRRRSARHGGLACALGRAV